MSSIPSGSTLSALQPEWSIRQAAAHYEKSVANYGSPITRARHRRKFIEYVADVLPVWGLEKTLEWLRQLLRGQYGQLDKECSAVVTALEVETATAPEGELRTAV